MADLAQLGIQVNVTDQNSAGKLTALSTAADKLAQSSEKLEKIVSRASDVLNKLGTASEQSAKKTKTATEQAARGYALLMGDINKLNRAIKEIGTDTLGLKILSADFKTLEKEMIKAYQAGKLDIEGFKRLGASAGKLSSRLKEQRATVEDLNAARMKEADLMAKAHIQELKWAQAKKDNMALYKAEQNEIKKNTERRRADIAAIEKELIAQDKLNAKRKEVAASYSYHDREAQKYTENLKKQTELTNKFKEVLSEVGRRIKQFGAFIAAAFVLTTVIQSIQAAITTIIDFDQALKSLQAIAGATAIEAKVMGDTIKQIAADTKFSANEVAEGMQTIGKAGFTAGEALQIIQGVSNLATGALEDFNSVANLVITAVRAFGLEVVQTGQITDTFANAITKSKLSVDGLKTAFGYVGAAGSQAGLSIEEVSGTLMVLADNGIRASTMGTALRKTLLGMIAPNSDLQNALNRVGMSLDQINPGMVGYEQALKNLAPLVWDFERNTVDMAKAQEFFGIRASQVAAILIRETAEGGGISNAIKSTKELGAALKMAEKQQEGLGVKFKNLSDSIKNVALAVGEGGLNNALHNLNAILKTTVTWLEKFIKAFPVVEIAGWATAITGVVGAVYALGKALKYIQPALAGLWLFAKSPWGIALVTITAITTALLAWIPNIKNANQALEEQNVALQQTISTMDGWVNVLNEATKKGKEFYDTALLRFVSENKELAKGIVEVVNAHDLLNGTMISSVEQITSVTEGWREYSAIIDEALKIGRFEAANKAVENFATNFKQKLIVENKKAMADAIDFYTSTVNEFKLSFSDFSSEIDNFATKIAIAAQNTDDPFAYVTKAIDEFEKSLENLKIAPEFIEEIMKAVKAKLTLKEGAGISPLKNLFAEIPAEIKAMVDKLPPLDLVKFEESREKLIKDLTKQIAEAKKLLDDASLDPEIKEDALNRYNAKLKEIVKSLLEVKDTEEKTKDILPFTQEIQHMKDWLALIDQGINIKKADLALEEARLLVKNKGDIKDKDTLEALKEQIKLYTKLSKKVDEVEKAEKEREEIKKRTKEAKAELEYMEDWVALIEEGNTAQEATLELEKEKLRIRLENAGLNEDEIQHYKDLLDTIKELKAEEEKINDALEDAFKDIDKAAADLWENVADNSEKATSEIDKQWNHVTENIHDALADCFKDMFDEGLDSWGNFFDSILGMAKSMFAQMAAYDVMGYMGFNVGDGVGLFTGQSGGESTGGFLSSLTGGGIGNLSSLWSAGKAGYSFLTGTSAMAGAGTSTAGMMTGVGAGQVGGATAGGFTAASTVPWIAAAAIAYVGLSKIFEDRVHEAMLDFETGKGANYQAGQYLDTDVQDLFSTTPGRMYVAGRDTMKDEGADQVRKIFLDYYESLFEALDEETDQALSDILGEETVHVHIDNLAKNLEEHGIETLFSEINDAFFGAYTDNLADAMFGAGAGEIVTGDFLKNIQVEGEDLSQTFFRMAGVFEKFEDPIERLATISEETGASTKDAYAQLEFLGNILDHADAAAENLATNTVFQGIENLIDSWVADYKAASEIAGTTQEELDRIANAGFEQVGAHVTGLTASSIGGMLNQSESPEQFMQKLETQIREGLADAIMSAFSEAIYGSVIAPFNKEIGIAITNFVNDIEAGGDNVFLDLTLSTATLEASITAMKELLSNEELMNLLREAYAQKEAVQKAVTGGRSTYNHPDTIQNTFVESGDKITDFLSELNDIIDSYDISKMSAIAQSFKEITDWKESKITEFTEGGFATEYLIGEMEKERARFEQEINAFYANAGGMGPIEYDYKQSKIYDKHRENMSAISIENAEFFDKIEEAYTVKLQELVDSVGQSLFDTDTDTALSDFLEKSGMSSDAFYDLTEAAFKSGVTVEQLTGYFGQFGVSLTEGLEAIQGLGEYTSPYEKAMDTGIIQDAAKYFETFYASMFTPFENELATVDNEAQNLVKSLQGLAAEYPIFADYITDISGFIDGMADIQKLQLARDQMSMLGQAQAQAMGLDSEYELMRLESTYGVNLGSTKNQQDILSALSTASFDDFLQLSTDLNIPMQTLINDMLSLANIVNETKDEFEGLADNIRDYTGKLSLSGKSYLSPDLKTTLARAEFQELAALALSTDKETAAAAMAELPAAADTLLDLSRQSNTSMLAYNTDMSLVLSSLKQAEEHAEDYAGTGDDALSEAEEQTKHLKNLSHLVGINGSIQDIDSKIKNLWDHPDVQSFISDFDKAFGPDKLGTLNTAVGDLRKTVQDYELSLEGSFEKGIELSPSAQTLLTEGVELSLENNTYNALMAGIGLNQESLNALNQLVYIEKYGNEQQPVQIPGGSPVNPQPPTTPIDIPAPPPLAPPAAPALLESEVGPWLRGMRDEYGIGLLSSTGSDLFELAKHFLSNNSFSSDEKTKAQFALNYLRSGTSADVYTKQEAIDIVRRLGREYFPNSSITESTLDRTAVVVYRSWLDNPGVLSPQMMSILDTTYDILGYASGGDHPGGWRIVGEMGPELEYTGPSYIASHSNTAGLLSNANKDVVEELRQMRAENLEMKKEFRELSKKIIKLNIKMNTRQEVWDKNGMPEVRA